MSHVACPIPLRPAALVADVADTGTTIPPLILRLSRLRSVTRERVVPELILILEQFPTAELPLPVRFAALQKLERAVVRVAAGLARAYAGAPPAAVDRSPGLSLEQRMYAAMAGASVHLLHELDHGQGFFLEQHAYGRRWAIRAALRFLSRALLYAAGSGRPWPTGAWQCLHDLFVYLVMRGTVQIHAESLVGGDDELDPELVYKRLVMIGLVVEWCGHRRVDRGLIERLRSLAADSRLVASDGLIGEFGLILVDVGRDAPAQIKIGSLDDPFRGWVLRVPAAFGTLLRSLERGRRPAAAGH